MGITVLRVDAWDAAADGVPLYNMKTGAPESPEANRAAESDKDAWDRNYGLKFLVGGASACGLIQLATAQERGVGRCAHIEVQNEDDFARGLDFLAGHLGNQPVGLGWDLATTEGKMSNPSALAVTEKIGTELRATLILTWKTNDPAVAADRARRVVRAVAARREGGPARALHIDATNERYFASTVQRAFVGEIPVSCIVGSETIEIPGYEPRTLKQYLGGVLVGELDDNHVTLPPERYVKEDFRLVKKDRGLFACEPDVQGRHGDTFDAVKLSLNALKGSPPPSMPAAPNSARRQAIRGRRSREVIA
jgi:hypothetical protein